MSSAYGNITLAPGSRQDDSVVSAMLASLSSTLKLKDDSPVSVRRVLVHEQYYSSPTSSPSELLLTHDVLDLLHRTLNQVIDAGDSYPQENPLSLEQFKSYFLSNDAFVVINASDSSYPVLPKDVLGTFYIKPNFPGRCSHVCNGGFITVSQHRGNGVGTVMSHSFQKLAPLLGYQASMFNLVFANNHASVNLWKKTGFIEIGRLPKAGRLSNSEEKVDAIMFYMDFNK